MARIESIGKYGFEIEESRLFDCDIQDTIDYLIELKEKFIDNKNVCLSISGVEESLVTLEISYDK